MNTDILCKRLDELADAVAKGPGVIAREFTMRVPAEPDRDADLVLSSAADQIRKDEALLRQALEALEAELRHAYDSAATLSMLTPAAITAIRDRLGD